MKRQKTKTKTKTKTKNQKIGQGWLTTDEEEIFRRFQRAQTENLSIKVAPTEQFGENCFVVTSNNKHYFVELRSKKERINSCDCPDYQSNGLGTCKHIERALRYHKSKKLKPLPSVTIYLDRRQQQYQQLPLIRVLWSIDDKLKKDEHLKKQPKFTTLIKQVNRYFSSGNQLLNEPLDAIPSLKRMIAEQGYTFEDIKISQHIEPFLQQLSRYQFQKVAKSEYLQDLEQGKRNNQFLKFDLYDYQISGMYHLAFNGRALLADEMGLGKTIQAIGAAVLLSQIKNIKRVLIISPVSLKTEWEEQIVKFCDKPYHFIQGNKVVRTKSYQQESFFYLANYEQVRYDVDEIQRILNPDLIILDEAQRIKNWQTKTAQFVKELQSPYLFILTGTPVENRIDEIYSLTQALDPHIFGPLFRFNREFYRLDEKGRPSGYKNLSALNHRLKPILLRRRKSDIDDQLPQRTVNTFFVEMTDEQQAVYEEYNANVARIMHRAKQRPLKPDEFQSLQINLACMRMICDSLYILDQENKVSPKLKELKPILDELLSEPENKIIIFSEWTRMLDLVCEYLDAKQMDYALHTGQVPQKKRRELINRFKNDAECRLFLSSDAGATGLNLQVANTVINLDIPWNPAKLEQRIARAWRKHQTRAVTVINMVCENSIEHRILYLLEQKTQLSDTVLDGTGEDDMDMPSGGKVLIERLNSLINEEIVVEGESSYQDIEKENSEETGSSDQKEHHEPGSNKLDTERNIQDSFQEIVQDIQAQTPDSLEQMDIYDNNGEKVLFAVVKTDIEQVESIFQQQDYLQNYQLDDIKVIDQKTMKQMEQLEDAGIITLNQQQQSVFKTEPVTVSQDKEQQKWLQQARENFKHVEYQQKMAEVLFSNGFTNEALEPITNAFKQALSATYLAITGKKKVTLSKRQIEMILIEKAALDESLLNIDQAIESNEIKMNADSYQELNQLIDTMAEKLIAYATNGIT